MRPFLDQLWRSSSLAMNRQEAKIFVGGLNWSTSEEKLRSYFENFGSVQEAFVSYDRHTGRPRGFGFVVFEDPLVADKVVSIQHTIDRREVEAKKAVPKDDQPTARYGGVQTQRTRKIFVGGLAPSVDELAFRKYFEQYGSVEDAVVMYDHDNKRPRGFGFISFYSEEAVDLVLASGVWKTLHDKPIEIKRAVPRDQMPLGSPAAAAGPRSARGWPEASRGISSGRGVAFGLQGQPLLSQVYGSSRPPYDSYSAQQPLPGYSDLNSGWSQTPLGLGNLGQLAGLLNQQPQPDMNPSAQPPNSLPHSLPSTFQHLHAQHSQQLSGLSGFRPGSSLPSQGLPDSPHVSQHYSQIPYQMQAQAPQYASQLNHLSPAPAPPSQHLPQSTAAALASLGLGSDFGSRTSGLFSNLNTEHSASSFGALDLDRRMAATMGGLSNETTFIHPFETTASPHSSPQSSGGHSASQPDPSSHRHPTSLQDAPVSVLGSTTPPPPGPLMPSYTSSPGTLQSPFADSAQSLGTAASPKTPGADQLLSDQLELLSMQDKMFVRSYSKEHSEVLDS